MPSVSLEPHPSASRPVAILVVEDDVLIRLSISEILRECGYTVYETGNVAEAQAIFQAGLAVDVVFSDVQMPGEQNGFDLARWVRAHHPDTPVILTSGVARMAEDAADLCGQADFVSKPYDHGSILMRMRALLEARSGSDR